MQQHAACKHVSLLEILLLRVIFALLVSLGKIYTINHMHCYVLLLLDGSYVMQCFKHKGFTSNSVTLWKYFTNQENGIILSYCMHDYLLINCLEVFGYVWILFLPQRIYVHVHVGMCIDTFLAQLSQYLFLCSVEFHSS